ncbi:hypothetical protein [Enterococcus olivae]
MKFEQLVAEEVAVQLQIILPSIKEEIKKELEQDKNFREMNQILFNQKECAKRMGVCVSTFREWRKQGLESEPMVGGELRFDINKVRRWKLKNDKRKAK